MFTRIKAVILSVIFLGGVPEFARAEINVSLSDSLYTVGPGESLNSCEQFFTLRYQVPADELFRIAVFDLNTSIEQTVSDSGTLGDSSAFTLTGTGETESVRFSGPSSSFQVFIRQAITTRKGTMWSTVVGTLIDVERTNSIVLPGGLPTLNIAQQPRVGGNGEMLQRQPILTTIANDGTRFCNAGYEVEVVLSGGSSGALGGDTRVSVIDGVARFSDLTLSGVIDEDYVLQFFILRGEAELRSEEPVNSDVLKFTISPDTVSTSANPPDPAPSSVFVENEAEIRQTAAETAQRSLSATLGAIRRMTGQARGRFIEARLEENSAEFVGRNHIPFDVNGTFNLDGMTVSTRGDFFEQSSNYDSTQRRLFFGDFDVQHDADTNSTTATLSARVAWERMTSDDTMLGYFVGGELATSNISGAFEGDQERVAVTVGGYAVHELADQVYFDGFLSYGIGRNDLDMASNVLALESDYTTRTATAGVALSGAYEYERYEFRPELAFSYGKTWIGTVGFTGRAYGLVDDTLSLDAGSVSIANLTLRPEVTWALDASTVDESRSQLSFAPRAICERTMSTIRTEHCGGGAELGLNSMSEDGLSTAEFRIIMDRVGNSNRSSFVLNLEHRF